MCPSTLSCTCRVAFKTKNTLALDMMRRALDAGYGNSSKFREGVRRLGLNYAVAVES